MIVLLPLIGGMLCHVAFTAPKGTAPWRTPNQIIRMDVGLVILHATVTDAGGNIITGLKQGAFKLFVDDRPQPITAFQGEDAPVSVGMIIDNSASMRPVRSDVIAAGLAFARASNPLDQLFVVHVNDRARLALPSDQPFTDDISVLDAALSSFNAAGSTALYDATGLGLAHLEKASITKRVLLIISDGGDNSSHITLPALTSWAQQSRVAIFSIGLFNETDQDQKPGVLKQLSESSGGKAFFPSSLSDIKKVSVQIAKDIRAEYTLGFTGVHDGNYHKIRVTADDPTHGQLTVHTRPGYTAEKR